MGFTVGQVVHDYGDICQSVTELALERIAPITTAEFRTLNRCLDDAIANAVTEYDRQRDARIAKEGTERHGVFAHELRDLLGTAMLSFDGLRTGSVPVGAATGLLGRSLSRLRDFVERSLASVRLEAGMQNRERIAVAELIGEVGISAAMHARTRGIRLTVALPDGDVAVEADRQILASAVANLLQNAFKFTRPDGHVFLRSFADADRVLIEVEDECGGLPPGDPQALFLSFEQRSRDRTGLGLGLAISHRGVAASGGVLHVRDLPGTGCVFTVELPRAIAAAEAGAETFS
jgi:signal transduction histidine kinase